MLTPKREAFAVGLAEGLSQAAAYRRAFPCSVKWSDNAVHVNASKLASDTQVRLRVAELTTATAAKSEVKLEQIAGELARLSFFDVRKLVRDDGTPLGLHELDDNTARAIVGLDVVSVGNAEMGVGQVLKFKLADKGANLERLAKLLGYFLVDNKQRTPPAAIVDLRDATPEQLRVLAGLRLGNAGN